MIKLDPAFVTTIQHTLGTTVLSTKVTDTLQVLSVTINLSTGTLFAIIRRGTPVDGVFTENMTPLQVAVNADGTFTSLDTTWSGTVPLASLTALLTSLRSAFDQFILTSGSVTGVTI